MRQHPDRLAQFSHVLTQIKFIILEIVIFLGFLMWVWDKIRHDYHVNFESAPVSAPAQPLTGKARSPGT